MYFNFFPQKGRLPFIIQNEIIACGHACALMISLFFGHQIEMEDLLKLLPTSIQGTSLLNLKELLERLGFMTQALKISAAKLKSFKGPAILFWKNNHFVVFNKIKRNKFIIHDPAKGVLALDFEELETNFSGVILTVEPKIDMQIIIAKEKHSWWKSILKIDFIKRLWCLLLILCFAMELISLLNPLFIQYITDNLISNRDLHDLLILALGFAILIAFNSVLDYAKGYLIIISSKKLIAHSASLIFQHLLKLPLTYFITRQKGDIQARFQAIDELQKKITEDFIAMILDGLIIILHIFVMSFYSIYLSLIVCTTVIIVLVVRIYSFIKFKENAQTSMHYHATSATYFLETIQSMLTLKIFAKEQLRLHGWRSRYISALNKDISNDILQLKYQIFQKTLFSLEQLLSLGIGALFVMQEKLSLGMLIAFLAYRMVFIQKTSMFFQYIFEFKIISLSLARLNDILQAEPEPSLRKIHKIEPLQGNIILKNISYSYHPNAPKIISNFSMEVKAGEKIALIGASGSGKTTLLKIMLGLLKPTSGEIYLDDLPFNWFSLQDYRSAVAAVMQEDVLFNGSLLENISFFENDIDLPWLYEVCKIAEIHEDILKFPMGYETIIGELGSCLSGGQKQRLILARALYKRPKILFLDEATSHLDCTNENKINLALKKLPITQIIVAHRPETIKSADRIITVN